MVHSREGRGGKGLLGHSGYASDDLLRHTLLPEFGYHTGALRFYTLLKPFFDTLFPGVGNLVPQVTFGSHIVLEFDLFLRGKGSDFRGFKQEPAFNSYCE